MEKIVAIHQPNYLPWLGYFYKMAISDTFVLLDNVQFTKNSFQNRVKIKTSQGENWLTVPVVHKFGQLTNEVCINGSSNWRSKHLKTIEMNYKKSPYFYELFPIIENAYLIQNWELLAPFCIYLIEQIVTYLKLDTLLVTASKLNAMGQSTGLLINIVKEVGGSVYISGSGGSKYQDEGLYSVSELSLQYSDFVHPTYNQLWVGFSKGLSIIDFLFNEGPNAFHKLINSSERVI